MVWSEDGGTASGRLDPFSDRFLLEGREQRLSIRFADLLGASIERGLNDRLHGLPVLELDRAARPPVRIASLEGTAALHELFDHVEHAGVNARTNAA